MFSQISIDAHDEGAVGLKALGRFSIDYNNIVIDYNTDLSVFLVTFHFDSVKFAYFNNQQILSPSNLNIPLVCSLDNLLYYGWPAALGLLLFDDLRWLVLGIGDEIDHLVLEGESIELY